MASTFIDDNTRATRALRSPLYPRATAGGSTVRPGFLSLAVVLATVLGGGLSPAAAVNLQGRLTTLAHTQERYTLGSDGRDLPLYEFLTLNAYDLGSRELSLHLDAFGVVDLRGDAKDTDRDGELTSAYLQWHDREHDLFVRAGRQYVRVGVTSDRLDGLYGDWYSDYHVGVQAFGGQQVNSDLGGDSGDYQWGGRLYVRYPRFELGFSGMEARDDDQLAFAQMGVDGWAQVDKAVAVNAHGYWDRVNEEWYDLQLLLTWDATDALVVSADGRRVIPNLFLSHTSIFGNDIFTTGEQREVGLRADYRLNRHLQLAAYTRYYDYSEGDADQWTGGGEARYHWGGLMENVAGAAYEFEEKLQSARLFGRYTHRLPRVTNRPDLRSLFAALDLIFYQFDDDVFPGDGRDYTYSTIATAGLDIGAHWQLTVSLDYGSRRDYTDADTVVLGGETVEVPRTRNTDLGFENDLDATLKLVYHFF